MLKQILVVDDDIEVCTFFSHFLRKKNYEVTSVHSGNEAITAINKKKFHLALLDMKLPDLDGLTLLKKIKEKNDRCPIIMMTGYSTVKSAVETMQLGALNYLRKPFDDLDELEGLIDDALNNIECFDNEYVLEMAEGSGFIVGVNQQMRELLCLARRIATKNVPVLIQGETGSGKEVVARFIHNCSKRANNPFIAINCAAISETLLESELFGYEKGAFTGATQARKGFFEIAGNGTLFLDELGESLLSTQAKLLRVIETGEFIRLGGEKVYRTDSRIIAATNLNLDDAVKRRAFRQDLFYRIDTITLTVPPLRERKEDIPLYIEYFLRRFTQGKDVAVTGITKESLEIMSAYDWPGNMRELLNVVQRLTMVVDEPLIKPNHLPEKILSNPHDMRRIEPEAIKPEHLAEQALGLRDDYSFQANNKVPIMVKDGIARLTEVLVEHFQSKKNLDLTKTLKELSALKDHVAKVLVEKALSQTLGDRKAAAGLLSITPRTLKYIYKGK